MHTFWPTSCSVLRVGNENIEQVQSIVFLDGNEAEKINLQQTEFPDSKVVLKRSLEII